MCHYTVLQIFTDIFEEFRISIFRLEQPAAWGKTLSDIGMGEQ
jgi:hypothetical protein